MNDENLNPFGGGDDSPLHWIKRPRILSPTSPSLPFSNLAADNPRQNSPKQTQKQKVLIQTISEQLIKYRTLRALNTMKELPDFSQAFSQFVRDEFRREADLILSDKDPPLKDFDINSLKQFSYVKSLAKLERIAPTLLASISGSISDSKSEETKFLSRKGFGGRRRDESVSLVPAIVQTVSAIIKNRHPNSISTVPAVNSLNNWTSHVPSRYFYLSNALGTSFSQKKTIQLVDKVNEAHARETEAMKDSVEEMLKTCQTKRERSARANTGVVGFSMLGDNVGKVVNPRHNTGLSNQGYYLQMSITLGVKN